MTKSKTLKPRISKNINFSDENYLAVQGTAIKYDLPFGNIVNMILDEWRRVNPQGIIKIGGNDHEQS